MMSLIQSLVLVSFLGSVVHAHPSPGLTRAEEDAHISLIPEDGSIKLCPIGRCRFYAESEDEMLKHALEYHGINETEYEGKAGGSKDCVAKIIYRRASSVWHARMLQVMLKHEVFQQGIRLRFLDPDLDLAHLTPGTSISDLFKYESCKYVFLILHPEDLKEAQEFKETGNGTSYYYPVIGGQVQQSWVEKEVASGYRNQGFGHIYIPMVADDHVCDDYYSKATSLPGILSTISSENQALSFESSNEMLACKMTDFMTGWSKTCLTDSCAKQRLMTPLEDWQADIMGLPHHPHHERHHL